MSLLLVIEDDPVQREVTAAVLRREGHDVLEAADGAVGLEQAIKRQPDLIVCDVMMPTLNGYQLVGKVRQNPILTGVPVLLLTAMSKRADIRTGMSAGADDYLPKPFSTAELLEAVASLLTRRRLRESRARAVLQLERADLARAYETRLLRELNTRWARTGHPPSDWQHPQATLLQVSVLGGMRESAHDKEAFGIAARQAYQAARDSLYLFGARQLLPYGNDVLAVFAAEPGTDAHKPLQGALRAAFSIVQSTYLALAPLASNDASLVGGAIIALSCGPVSLMEVQDALHGDQNSVLANGTAVDDVAAVHRLAQAQGWSVAATAVAAAQAPKIRVMSGGMAAAEHRPEGLPAVELALPQAEHSPFESTSAMDLPGPA